MGRWSYSTPVNCSGVSGCGATRTVPASTVAATLLRLAVADTIGVPADQVAVDRRCSDCGQPHGRPMLPGTGMHASISHSAGRVAVALTGAGPIGIDVESIRGPSPHELVDHILGAGEEAATPRAFFVYWTRKEAAVKATGDGLRVPLTEVLVTGPDEPPRLRRYCEHPGLSMALFDLDPGDGYVAALAVVGDIAPRIEQAHVTELCSAAFR